MATKIKYNGNIIATLDQKDSATLTCKGKRMKGNITVIAPEINEVKLQEKTICDNCEAMPDEGYDGFSKVIVDVPIPDGYIIPSGNKDINENCTEDITEYASVTVNVPIEELDEYVGIVTIKHKTTIETEVNESGGTTCNINTKDYTTTTNESGGLTYDIGGI